MSETLEIATSESKSEIYETLLPQIDALIDAEPDPVATMANVASALWMTFGHLWTGFYRVVDGQLILGPFQGPLACTRIRYGRGVCGTAWAEKRTLVVPDVDQFPGHIACSSSSRSEIVVPIFRSADKAPIAGECSKAGSGSEAADDREVVGLIDIDSAHLAAFDEVDAHYLRLVAASLSKILG